MITIDENETWSEDKDYRGQDILITNGAILTIDSHSNGDKQIVIKCKNLTVDEGAKISGSEKGYLGGNSGHHNGYGPGYGHYSAGYAGGGGYGGKGGTGYNGGAGGIAYGSLENPIEQGSGAGYSDQHENGGNGGGSIRIFLWRTLTINGIIEVNGEERGYGSAGGAGGGVYLLANTVEGEGTVKANGATGKNGGGGGGGGRIAIIYFSKSGSLSFEVNRGGGEVGADGAVYEHQLPTHIINDLSIKWYQCETWTEGDNHGGDIDIDSEIISDQLENIFDDVMDAERTSGKTEYRKIYVKLQDNVLYNAKLWIDQFTPNPDDEISISASGTNEDTQEDAEAYNYISPTSFANSIDLGHIEPSGYRPVWIKRVVQPYAVPWHHNTFKLAVGF